MISPTASRMPGTPETSPAHSFWPHVLVREAKQWAGIFVASGIATGALFGARIFWCFAAVVAINAAYSFGGRNVVYLDVVLNALPHVVRFLMGRAVRRMRASRHALDGISAGSHLIVVPATTG